MAPLPSSGPLSINDIRVELGQSQANSSLRSLSNLAGFSTPDAISEFYGYSPLNYNFFYLVNAIAEDPTSACRLEGEVIQVYFAGSGGGEACPALTQTVYQDPGLTTPFYGENAFWNAPNCGAWYYILTDGFIEGVGDCG
jgi:hypothetical protein